MREAFVVSSIPYCYMVLRQRDEGLISILEMTRAVQNGENSTIESPELWIGRVDGSSIM